MAGHSNNTDEWLGGLLANVRSIAVVGLSAHPDRPSHRVARFLQRVGYVVYGINPGLAADAVPGIPVVASLQALPEPIDMVDVFRNSAAAGGVVDEALMLAALPRVIWMQLGVRDDAAAARAEARGLEVVMDRCPAIEIPRLGIRR